MSGTLAPSEPSTTRALMRPYALFYVYRNRLRVHAAQELLAGLGVAIAVALVFATLVASDSVTGSAGEVVHAVIGPATLQLRARGSEGFDERLLPRVQRLAGVERAAPLLEQTAAIVGPDGRRVIVVVAGTNISFAKLDGLAHTLPVAALASRGIGLSKTSADALSISSQSAGLEDTRVSLRLRGIARSLEVSAVLGSEAFGALSRAQVAVMPLPRLQQLAGLRGRLSRILVEARPGREQMVRAELQRLVAGRLAVAPADQDIALLRQALRPSDQASTLFAVISALLGFLLAFNAMLLTVPERRQAIADLRIDGTMRTAIVQMVLFQGLCLGVVASLVGLLAGYALSTGVFQQSPGYLSQAFTLGTSTVVGVRPILLALAGGVFATCLASMVPLFDLRRGRALDAVYHENGVPGNALLGSLQRRLGMAALGLLLLASALFALAPSTAILACVVLALATVLAIPLMLAGVLGIAGAFAKRNQDLALMRVALTSLRATTIRSLALAATGAVALFGSIALGGAQDDLLRGLGVFARAYAADAEIWVLNPGYTPETTSFPPGEYASKIAHIPGVVSVRSFQNEFMNMGGRRVVIVARPPGTGEELLRSQIVSGSLAGARKHLAEGGWVTASRQLAEEQHAGLGQTLTLPSPTGTVDLRLAALTTNFGWPGGAVLMNTSDYSDRWETHAPSALAVDLAPGVNLARARGAIAASLGAGSGLEVITAATWSRRFDTLAGEGLSQLSEISTLLVLAAILAMAAALGSSIWQRRLSLAGLRLEGTLPSRLWRVLLIEAVLMLSAGCLVGALAGIYGQVVIDGYLKHVTGFPVASFATGRRPLEIFVLVVAVVLMGAALAGWFAARVSPTLGLDE